MTAFTDAASTLFADPNLSVAATYTAAGGSPVAVRVIVTRDDGVLSTFGVGTRNAGWKAALKKAQVPNRPRSDDALSITEGTSVGSYLIRDVQESAERMAWHCTLNAA